MTTMTTDKLAGMAAIVKNLPYFGFGNLATLGTLTVLYMIICERKAHNYARNTLLRFWPTLRYISATIKLP